MKITQVKKSTFKPFSINIEIESEDERDDLILDIENITNFLPSNQINELNWLKHISDICENNKVTE